MFSITKKRSRMVGQNSEIKQLIISEHSAAQITKLNINGNRWFMSWNFDGKYKVVGLNSRLVHGVLDGKMPNLTEAGFEGQNPAKIGAFVKQFPVFSLAVFSAELEPLCVISHKDIPKNSFTLYFDHDRVIAAADLYTKQKKESIKSAKRMSKLVDSLNANGNRWFVYSKDEQKVFKANSDQVKSLMSNGVLASYAVFTKDFKLIREFRNPALAEIEYDFVGMIGAFTAAAVGYEIQSEGFDILENIF